MPVLLDRRAIPCGNTKGFALSFPKPEIDAPVWRASPAGPRQGIDSGFPSPSHPRRKAGGMAEPCSPEIKVVPEMAMLLIAAEIALWFFIRSIPILNWQETRLVYVQGAA